MRILAALLVCAALSVMPSLEPASAGNPLPIIEQRPEGNANNVSASRYAANLWICETGPCDGPGEGELNVVLHASNVITQDGNSDGTPDGLGAYEYDYNGLIESNQMVLRLMEPASFQNIVFSPGGAGEARGPAVCAMDMIFMQHHSCQIAAPGFDPAGPNGAFDLENVIVRYGPWLIEDLRPGVSNQVSAVLDIERCEMVDVNGLPLAGSVGGGDLADCRDINITVRMLQGDLNLDCHVDVQDQQLIAYRLGSAGPAAPENLYDDRYDIEPNAPDGDIDISDVQRVFGRDGSTCQAPIPAQPPLPLPTP
jgi:hypothetical protein